jgi:hypothetical protein
LDSEGCCHEIAKETSRKIGWPARWPLARDAEIFGVEWLPSELVTTTEIFDDEPATG